MVSNFFKCQKVRMIALSFYCLLSGGCGKRVEKADNNNTRSPALSTNKIQLKASAHAGQTYTLSQMGEVLIPPHLEVEEGGTTAEEARISFNLKNGRFEIFCKYSGSEDRFELENCYSSEDINELSGLNFPAGYGLIVDPDHSIKLEISNPTTNSKTEIVGEFEILWH